MSRSKLSVACVLVSVCSLVVVSQGKAAPITVQSYAYTGTHVPHSSYLDNGAAPGTGSADTELIDGQYPTIGVGTTYTDVRWVGVINSPDDSLPHPEITFDLGANYLLSDLTVIYDVDNGVGIHAPDSLSVSFSNDNVTYTTPVSLFGFDNTGSTITRSDTFGLAPGSLGQYARLQFFNDQQWTFLAEISFDGQLFVPAPEPSSLLLLGFGTLGMVKFTRRRRRQA